MILWSPLSGTRGINASLPGGLNTALGETWDRPLKKKRLMGRSIILDYLIVRFKKIRCDKDNDDIAL